MLWSVASLVLLWAYAASALHKEDCPRNLIRDIYTQVFGDKCYRFEFSKERVYADARTFCVDQGGLLAMPKSKEINDFLTFKLINLFKQKRPVWIGLDDLNYENFFRWVDGSEVKYSNFANPKEGPRFGNGHVREDCVTLDPSSGGKWRDFRCENAWIFVNARRHYICEFPAVEKKVVP